jgi:pSer/pThr/pTyr-binding forkhead associated (FHA) protein
MASLRLVPISGPAIEGVKDPSVVGREPNCEIVVSDGSVSRKHARLERRGETWWVVDLGSANGTYVNSLKVGEQALKNGQELRFGALAFRVDVIEDSEATVSAAVLPDDSATVMAPASPPPVPPTPPAGTPARPPAAPRVTPPAAGPPPIPRSPAGSPERKHPGGARAAPVGQMPAGAAPEKKGKSPIFWVAIGCCGCLLAVAAVAAIIGGGAFMATKAPADAAHAWLADARDNRMDAVEAGLTTSYRSRLSQEDLESLVARVQVSKDATFPGRSVDNDRAILTGVLTGTGTPQPVVIRLVKEGGDWKVDDVHFGMD